MTPRLHQQLKLGHPFLMTIFPHLSLNINVIMEILTIRSSFILLEQLKSEIIIRKSINICRLISPPANSKVFY